MKWDSLPRRIKSAVLWWGVMIIVAFCGACPSLSLSWHGNTGKSAAVRTLQREKNVRGWSAHRKAVHSNLWVSHILRWWWTLPPSVCFSCNLWCNHARLIRIPKGFSWFRQIMQLFELWTHPFALLRQSICLEFCFVAVVVWGLEMSQFELSGFHSLSLHHGRYWVENHTECCRK